MSVDFVWFNKGLTMKSKDLIVSSQRLSYFECLVADRLGCYDAKYLWSGYAKTEQNLAKCKITVHRPPFGRASGSASVDSGSLRNFKTVMKLRRWHNLWEKRISMFTFTIRNTTLLTEN